MIWFWKKRELRNRENDDIKVEVSVSREATKREVERAKAANKKVLNLLEANHFTVQIYRTAQLGNSKESR